MMQVLPFGRTDPGRWKLRGQQGGVNEILRFFESLV